MSKNSSLVFGPALLSKVCHDLKDPLAAISMGAAFLNRVLPPDESNATARRAAEAIRRSVDRMNQVIADFSELGKLELKQIELDVRPHALQDIAAAAREELGLLMKTPAMALQVDLAETAAALSVACDKRRLLQILGCLTSCAVLLSPDAARIEVRIDAKGPQAVRMQVRAVPKDAPLLPSDSPDESTVAEPFSLAIARRLIDLHGGQLDVTQAEGESVTLSFALPLASAGGEATPSKSATSATPATSRTRRRGSKVTGQAPRD